MSLPRDPTARVKRLTPDKAPDAPCIVHVDTLSISLVQRLRYWKWAALAAGHSILPNAPAPTEPVTPEPIAWQDARDPQATPEQIAHCLRIAAETDQRVFVFLPDSMPEREDGGSDDGANTALQAWASDAIKYSQKYSHVKFLNMPPQDPATASLSLDELRRGGHGCTEFGTSPSRYIYFEIEYAMVAELARRYELWLEREAKAKVQRELKSATKSATKPARKGTKPTRPTPTPTTIPDEDITG